MPFLRQSTTQVILFGPCLDKTDGATEETGLTLAQADMRLSKDGGAFAQKSAAGNATHDSDGWYNTTLSTTDTDTVGELRLNVHQPANMLPVWDRWWVLEEDAYDFLFASGAAPDTQVAAIKTDAAAVITDLDNATDGLGALKTLIDTVNTDLSNGTDGLGAIKTDTAAILVDTGTTIPALLPTALVGGRIDATIDATGMETGAVDNILTRTMTEAYAANAAAPTLAQALFAIHQMLMQFGISGTTNTVRKLDNTATAFIVTLDDATNPTDAKRV